MTNTTPVRYLVRADMPFRGGVQSVLCADGTVAYTGGLSVEAYEIERGYKVRVVDDAELDTMIAAYVASLVTDATEETEEQYDYALDVLPPSRFCTHRGVEMFHICERITYDLVSWHARLGRRYFTFNDRATLSRDDVAAKVARAAGAA